MHKKTLQKNKQENGDIGYLLSLETGQVEDRVGRRLIAVLYFFHTFRCLYQNQKIQKIF